MLLEFYTCITIAVVIAWIARWSAEKKGQFHWPFPGFALALRNRCLQSIDKLPLAVTLVCLVLLFLGHLALVRHMDKVINPPGFIDAAWPVQFASYGDFLQDVSTMKRHVCDIAFVALAALETLVLYAVYRHLTLCSRGRSALYPLALCAIILYGLAFTAHAMISSDVYGYISSAKYGFAAYSAQTHLFFDGKFAILNMIDAKSWKVLPPCPYGPLWLFGTHALMAPAAAVWSAILVERAISAIAVLICGWAILRIRNSLGLAAIFVLNPMILFNFVVEAHNDILGLACVFLAAVSFQRPLIGIFWQVAAGLVKLPYFVISSIAANQQRSLLVRISVFVVAGILVLWLSTIFGGAAYLHALFFHVQENGQQHHVQSEIAHIILFAICSIALAFALFRKTYIREAVPAFAAMAVTIYPWYLAMALPYAIIGDVAPITVLATLPMSGLFADVLLGTRVVKIGLILICLMGIYVMRAGEIAICPDKDTL